MGIGRHLVDVPDCINVGDGGVDAYIENVDPTDPDVIPRGSSAFQIKSSDMGPTACRRELHVSKNLEGPLKGELDTRLSEGAAYVLVLSAEITPEQRQARLSAVREELASCGYEDTEVRVYTANQLAGFASRHPSVVTALRPDLSTCSPFEGWSTSRDVRHPSTFVADSERQRMVNQITDTLRTRSDCPVIRVTGLPGVGKTRSAHEALRPDDLRHQVLYVRRASDLLGTPLYNTLINDTATSAILVVDECDLEQHRQLTDAFEGLGPRLALITMSYEMGRVPIPTNVLQAQRLEKESIENILRREYPSLPSEIASRLSGFADGYPYIAVLLAEQYFEEPDVDYLSISDDRLMNRLIGGSYSVGSHKFTKTKDVLTGISLFQRIGVDGIGANEGRWLAEQFEVSWSEFQNILDEQRERGIVQGEYYVFVTPFMLRIHLLEEWWRAHGFRDESGANEFLGSMPPEIGADLIRRFCEHFPYVASAQRGAEFVRNMLGPDSSLSDFDTLNSELGSRLFLALTEADPNAALRAAQRVLGEKSPEDLLGFREGRRNTIEALKRMAVWRELFQPAARLLLALGEAETETWANNASGEFAGLFAAGAGPVAPTEAPPSERLPVLREALTSDSEPRRRLGLQACASALQTDHFYRMVGAEYQGTRREPDLWTPETYGEIFDAYRSVWELAENCFSEMEGQTRAEAMDVLLSNARGLTRYEALADMVIETIRSLSLEPDVDNRDLIENATEILHYDGVKFSDETRRKWEELEQDLSGDDFSSRMERYVAMQILVDQFDDEGNQVDQALPEIQRLASESIGNPGLLDTEIQWLVTSRAKSGNRFGYELGRRDTRCRLLDFILNAQAAAGQESSLSFIGGYGRALAERDLAQWETLLDELSQEPKYAGWIVELTWRAGQLTEQASRRIVDLVRSGFSTPETLRIFMYGGVIRSLSPADFAEWTMLLLESEQLEGASVALDLLKMYYLDSTTPIPKEPARSVICHPSWFRPLPGPYRQSHDTYWWADIAKSLCLNYADTGLEVAKLLLEHLGEEGTIVGGFEERPLEVLDVVMQQQPEQVWLLASPMLGPPVDIRAYRVASWLRGSESFEEGGSHILKEVPAKLIWAWVDEEPETRPSYLATFVPKVMCGPQDEQCLARELLIRYGARQQVRNALQSNFSTEGWVGPTSQHLSGKLAWLHDLRIQETHPNVLKWIDEFSTDLECRIDFARQEEELRDV